MFMYGFDSHYMMIWLIGLALILLPQMWVKNTVARYSQVKNARGLTGQQVAQSILSEHGLNVTVEPVAGMLSDHYDPTQKVVRLSEDIFYGNSVASVAIAAHECGHAIQHAKGFFPVVIRSALVPAANLGSSLGPLLIMASLVLGVFIHLAPTMLISIAWAGIWMFGAAVAFHIVTLPVEIDASMRGLKVLEARSYLTSDEMPGARKVLTAAACTYVATALYSLMHLLYYISLVLGAQRRD